MDGFDIWLNFSSKFNSWDVGRCVLVKESIDKSIVRVF